MLDPIKHFDPCFHHHMDNKIYMDIYTHFYNICTQNASHGKTIYDALQHYLIQQFKNKLPSLTSLSLYLEFFHHFEISAKFFHHTLNYLNRHWIKRELDEGKQVAEINATCFQVFRQHCYTPLQPQLFQELETQLTLHRSEPPHHNAPLQQTIHQLYDHLLTIQHPIDTLQSAYTSWMSFYSQYDFQMQHTLQLISCELDLMRPLECQQALFDVLIRPFKSHIVSQFNVHLPEQLHQAYQLLQYINDLQPFHDYIYNQMCANPLNDPIQDGIQLYHTYKDLLPNDTGCMEAMDRAMTDQLQPLHMPQHLAKQMDLILKLKSSVKMEDVLMLLNYTSDKDIFLHLYAQYMCKRLLYYSTEELPILMQLKRMCGSEQVNKLQRLYTDITTSREQMDVVVIRSASWPFPKEALQLHYGPLQPYLDSKHLSEDKILLWMPHYSTLEVQYDHYLLTMSFIQYLVLQQLEQQSMTLNQLTMQLNCPLDVLVQHTAILVKGKLLSGFAVPNDDLDTVMGQLTGEDTLVLQPLQSKRIKINFFQLLKRKEVKVDMEQDRMMMIQANIVRIMKSRKELKYVVLMNEVLMQLKQKFKPNIGMIKKCIDVLIEKSYLKRMEDQQWISYVA